MNLSFSRFRTSRGFGVHSPFAFKFILGVLRESCRYYAYDEIEKQFRSRKEQSRAKLLFRVVNYFRPEKVHCIGYDADVARQVVHMWSKRVRPMTGSVNSAEFIIITDSNSLESVHKAVSSAVSEKRNMVIFSYSLLPLDMPYGMTFTNGTTTVYVMLSHLSRQSFTLNFV